MNEACPLVIEFSQGAKIEEVPQLEAEGLPGIFVTFPDGSRVPLPTEQVVLQEQTKSTARLGLGGMSFEGMEDEKFVFWRVCDLLPESALPQDWSDKLTLEPSHVSKILIRGEQVYPRKKASIRAV